MMHSKVQVCGYGVEHNTRLMSVVDASERDGCAGACRGTVKGTWEMDNSVLFWQVIVVLCA